MVVKKYAAIMIFTLLIIVACYDILQVSGDAPNTLYYLHGNYNSEDFNSPQEMWPIDDNYMIVCAYYTHNFTIVDISDAENNVSLVSSIHVGGIPRKLDLSSDKNYAFIGIEDNFTIVNITDVYNPIIEGNLVLGAGAYLCGCSYVDSTTTAFCTDYNNNLLRSFNCADKTNPTLISSVACGNDPHGVWADATVAFCLGHKTDSVITYDVSNPASMSQLDSYSAGNLHRCSQLWGEYAPNIYVASLDASMSIFNISNPNNIVRNSFIDYGGVQVCNVVPNADETVLYVSAVYSGLTNSILYAYNIADKTNPVLIDSITGTDPGVTFVSSLCGGMVVNSNYIFCGDGDGVPDLRGMGVFRFGEEMPNPPVPEDEISFTKINDGENNSVNQKITPLINWTIVENTSSYQIQISNNLDFTDIVVNLSDINEGNYPSHYAETSTIVSFLLPSEYALPCIQYYFYRIKAYSVE